ncbi:MAG: M28 family metallopeptidase [Actinomycetota bacterium]
MLELIRVFLVNENVPTLVFVAFGSEEILEGYGKNHHNYGSRYMANHLSDLRGKVVAMISVDMVGVGSSILVNSTLAAPRVFADMFMEYAKANGIATGFRKDPGWSDHEAFENHGVPSFWVEYREDPNYHSPRDTYEKVQPDLMNQIGHLLQGFLESIDASDCRALAGSSVYR